MAEDRKLVWTAGELAEAGFTFRHPLDDQAEAVLTPLSRIARLQRAGVNLVRVPPGRRAFPAHRHHVEEEWVFVLSGAAAVRTGAEVHPLGPGGFAAFPPGGPAHAVENPSESEELVCLMGGENAPADVVDFADAAGRLVRTPGMLDVAPAGAFEPFDFYSRTPLPESAP